MYCEYKNEKAIMNGIMCGNSGDYCYSDQWCTGQSNEKRFFWANDTSQTDPGCYSIGMLSLINRG